MTVMSYNQIATNPIAEMVQRAGLAFGNAVLSLSQAIETHRRQARTRRELDKLSDAMLADIGLTRADIKKVAARS